MGTTFRIKAQEPKHKSKIGENERLEGACVDSMGAYLISAADRSGAIGPFRGPDEQSR